MQTNLKANTRVSGFLEFSFCWRLTHLSVYVITSIWRKTLSCEENNSVCTLGEFPMAVMAFFLAFVDIWRAKTAPGNETLGVA